MQAQKPVLRCFISLGVRFAGMQLILQKNTPMKHAALLFGLLCLCTQSWAQLNNRIFDYSFHTDSTKQKQLYLSFQSLAFNKNNEYFNKIADGYTLFGYQWMPTLSYYPHPNVRIDAGIYLQQDFGNSAFTTVAPVFTVKVKRDKLNILFGTLEGSTNHRLIEPIYDFERLLINRLEQGIQANLQTNRLFLDAWVNWENMIYPGDSAQEEVTGGLSTSYLLSENEKYRVELPFQLFLYHIGGQIDVLDAPIRTLANMALGLNIARKMPETSKLKNISLQAYATSFQEFSNAQIPFDQGSAAYININFAWHSLDVMGSYWRGNNFISARGGNLYQSISTTVNTPEVIEQVRELLILRIMHRWHVFDHLTIMSRFEPHYDFQNSKFEFSHGMYIVYNTDFKLGLLNRKN